MNEAASGPVSAAPPADASGGPGRPGEPGGEAAGNRRTGASTVRIVGGTATPEEIAALVAVLAAGPPAAAAPKRPAPRGWSDRAAHLRRPQHHGPAAWRASALPH